MTSADAVATFACLFALIGLRQPTTSTKAAREAPPTWPTTSYSISFAHMPIVALLVALVVDVGFVSGTAPAFLFIHR